MYSNIGSFDDFLLFSGISDEELPILLQCLSAREKNYSKSTYLFHAGDQIHAVFIVMAGRIHILQEDHWGNRNIVAEARPGDMFAESYACRPETPLGVSILAAEASTILYLDVPRILTLCDSACNCHRKLIDNLLSVIAEKNIRINQKLSHLMQRTTRQKLLAYLSAEAQHQKKSDFFLSFNRQQLADYLSVDRSALSAELSKLQQEGLLYYHKNHFVLL